MISLVLAAALFAAAEPAAPAATAAAPPTKSDKAKDPSAQVCKREAVLGSRMKQRVCMTQAEWDQRQRDDREMLDKAQSAKSFQGN
ncbi:MAG: hypothetical protein JNK30_22505 [Phenylobacterium sp.]|uniref:hypothetical protein n=1 Tax=Phenylobacterium sp. TaxID=1871053 RepID=UPI001A3AC177|nr:hypothetical protein [Phenylobacterium sp.]MBL8774177.1 hypothetical protein [Phenylobacterium sp.]